MRLRVRVRVRVRNRVSARGRARARVEAKGYYGHLSAQLAQPTRHQRIGLSKVPA